MNKMTSPTGHRERLRQRFLDERASLSDAELLELLLTYAIPRQDVAPLAARLLDQFGSLEQIFAAPFKELTSCNGVGERSVALLHLAGELQKRAQREQTEVPPDVEPEDGQSLPMASIAEEGAELPTARPTPPPPPPTKADIRGYIVDLSQAALDYLPQATEFPDVIAFSAFLEDRLPYNSGVTRKRYANYLTNRFFPAGQTNTALADFLARRPGEASAKQVLLYETVKAEPAVRYMVEEIIWSALPAGGITRDALKEGFHKRFPKASDATVQRMIYSLVGLYTTLDAGRKVDGDLRFRVRDGTLTAFVYVLGAEFPEPGIYAFEALEQGPMRYWLLWDRDWIRRQLYNLRDLGIIAKVSEIDNYRQFTLQYDRQTAMQSYFAHPERETLVLRERDDMEEAGS